MIEQNKLFDAENILKNLLQTNPQHPQAMFALAQVAIRSGANDAALNLLAQASILMPETPEPLLQLALQMAELKRFEHADACFQRALGKFTRSAECFFAYAGFLTARGEKNKAKALLEKVLELQPGHTGALLALTDKDRVPAESWLMKELLEMMQHEKRVSRNDLIRLNYALGKAYDDQGQFELAFCHWHHANQLQYEQCEFRVKQMLPFFQSLKKKFSGLNINLKSTNHCHLVPIFILGMPRSGSTLLEQILAAHSAIETAGEVDYLAQTIVKKMEKQTQKPYPECLRLVAPERLGKFTQDYLSQIRKKTPEAQYIIDKLPANFQSIGLIQQLMPQAVIVHLIRDPLPVGFSVFKNYFAENEPYFCDLEEFGRYYLAYQDLMTFWKNNNGQNIIEIGYEALVENPQTEITKILKACGLNWQNECLNYYQKDNYVTTLSNQQVRQPIYQSAKEKWRQYETQLAPLRAILTAET